MRRVLILALCFGLTGTFPGNVRNDERMARVTLNAAIDCKAAGLSAQSNVHLWLDDVLNAGREYYPPTTISVLGPNRLQIAFDLPAGVYEVFASMTPDAGATSFCNWNGPLMTLPGIARNIAITMKSAVTLWDRGDFASGFVAEGASVDAIRLEKTQGCGKTWTPKDGSEPSGGQTHEYYQQIPWLNAETQRPALVVAFAGHYTVVALPPIEREPLQRYRYFRRDITGDDLRTWASLPNWDVVCENQPPGHATFSGVATPMQTVYVKAFVRCSEANDLYQSETPVVEVEDQLHRGSFYFPEVTVSGHVGNTIDLRFQVPPGAYDLGLRLPKPRRITTDVLSCSSTSLFAVLPGHDRHLTFLICSCGFDSSYRGFISGALELPSVNVAVTLIPAGVACNADIPDLDKVFDQRREAVLDDGFYYGTYAPYDPSKRPVLILSGPGFGATFVAIAADRTRAEPQESSGVLDLTVSKAARWSIARSKLICEAG
jgi:hypothetical protein